MSDYESDDDVKDSTFNRPTLIIDEDMEENSFDASTAVSKSKSKKFIDSDMDLSSFDIPSTSLIPTSLSTSNSSKRIDDVTRGENSLPLILTNEYFIIVDRRMDTHHQQISNGVLALCQVCHKKISGSTKVTSNFLQHIKTKHPDMHQKYLRQKGTNHLTNRVKKRQNNFDEKVLNFVVATCLPLSVVENPAFLSLFDGTHLKVKSLDFLSDLLDTKYEEMVLGIKLNISKINYVCCTADVWTGQQRSFFGYTCHWIDSNFKRKSSALACRRFSGSYVSDIINEINTQFGITDKQLVCTVTDNASNFVNDSKDFEIQYADVIKTEQCMDSEFWFDNDHAKFNTSLLVSQLSKHVRCASHSLNLLATADFLKALRKIPVAYEKHQYSMTKCRQIWNKYNRPKELEQLKVTLSASLKTPEEARWNSLYDAIKQLLKLSSKQLTEITNVLGVNSFLPSEIEYLEEYSQFMKPIVEALDFLQKEEDIYFGYLAPTLLTLKAKLYKFATSPAAKYLKEISKDIQDTLIDRFRTFFELQSSSHDIVIAAITCPSVKIMNCTKLLSIWNETAPNCTVQLLEDIFVTKVITDDPQLVGLNHRRRMPGLIVHPFFSLDDSDEDELIQLPDGKRNMESVVIIKELRSFLENENSALSSLNKYPLIKHMFYKFNTPLPSSAPVERLFSFTGIVNHDTCQNITDEQFEKLVILKINEFNK